MSFLLITVFFPFFASAHQPRLVESRETVVSEPEVSKAYYGTLAGEPDVYVVQSATPFDLYVGVLVPDMLGQQKDISAVISKDGKQFAVLDGLQFNWKTMFEPFGYDTYWQGPEYKANVEAGTYVITVVSSTNNSKYSLAIGEVEKFDLKETVNALTLIPLLKRDFFNESPINFILSPFGWGLILVLYILAALVGFLYRYVLRKFAKGSVRGIGKNIGTTDRVIRFFLGIALLFWAICTTWSPIIIFISGFTLFEAVFSWCGLYAAIGRNTCPVD